MDTAWQRDAALIPHWPLTHQPADSISMHLPSSIPTALGQPPPTDHQQPVYRSGMASSNKLKLSINQITTAINVSVQLVNTSYEDIQHIQVPAADTSISFLYDFFDPIADHIHSMEMKQGHTLLHCAAGVSHPAASCLT